MSRGQFVLLTLMMSLAVFAGVVVSSLIPPVQVAQAQELELAPRPSPGAAIETPSFADLAERALPSVVQITSTSFQEENVDPMFENEWFRRFFRQGPENREPNPRPRPRTSGGSGFFITKDGYILTNKHVVEEGELFRVQTYDGEEREARLVGQDPYLDLALLKIDGNGFEPLALGDSETIRVGEWVMAIGHPIRFPNTVTVGVISGKARDLAFSSTDLGRYIQTDAAINFGNSGGPLINARGEVIGINTAIVRGGMGGLVEGIGFALPVNEARRVLDQLVATGTVQRGWLGVSVRGLDDEAAEFYGFEGGGALVSDVTEGSPADEAGLQEDDVIVSVDGEEVEDSTELVYLISRRSAGETVRLGVRRLESQGGGASARLEISVTLGERRVGLEELAERAPTQPETGSASGLGITVEPLPPNMREMAEEQGIEGVMITDVDPTSEAWAKGLRPEQFVEAINNVETPTLTAYRQALEGLEPGSIARLRVSLADGTELSFFLRVPEGN